MKRFLAIVPIILCLVLASCGAPEVQRSYSFKFGYVSEREDGLLESFVYDVEAKDNVYDASGIKPPFHLVGKGTYTINVYRDAEDPNLFKLATSFSFKGRYKYPDTDTYSDEFEDSFTGETYMRVGNLFFEPVSMYKEYLTTIPYQDGLRRASYKVEVEYKKADGGFSVKSKVTDRDIEGAEEGSIIKIADEKNSDASVEIKGRVMDAQEMIFFVVRLQKIDESFSDSFAAYNPMDVLAQNVNIYAQSEKMSKKFEGKDYACFQLTAGLKAQDLSASVTLFFTEVYPVKYVSDQGMETPHNASLLLEIKQGDLLYTLKEYANYARKA